MERCTLCGDVVNPGYHAHVIALSDDEDGDFVVMLCSGCAVPILAHIASQLTNAQQRANRHLN